MHSDHSLYFRFTMASVDHDPQRPKTPNTHLPVHWHSENFGLEVCKGWAIANVKWLPVPQAFLLSPQESIITKPGKPLVSRLPAAHRGGAGRRGGGFQHTCLTLQHLPPPVFWSHAGEGAAAAAQVQGLLPGGHHLSSHWNCAGREGLKRVLAVALLRSLWKAAGFTGRVRMPPCSQPTFGSNYRE